jgi:PKD repeat protein
VGGVNIWKSTNSGSSWTKTSSWTGFGGSYVHADIHNIAFLPGSGTTIYAGDDGGVHKTTSTGSTWSDIGAGLEIAQQYSIGLSGSNSTEWITGWQDNGTNLANGGAWSEPLGGDGMMCFIDYSNNNYMYGEQYNGSFNMSSNGGAGWTPITNGLTETGAWVTPWLLDPQNSATIIAGLSNVWKSTNRGSSWTKISTFGNGTSTLTAVAVAPSNDLYIYALGNGALYATTDGGTTWNNVTGNLPVGSATNITVDPANPLRVWVTIGGFTSGQKVYQSVTGGTTWTNISNGLPNLPVLCIAYQGAGIDGMYIGTYVGVYYRDTTNTAGAWVAYNTGLPNVIVCDLKIYAPGSSLRAATYGRGTWQIGLYQPAGIAPVANFTAFPTTLCANGTVQFTDTSSNQPTSWQWRLSGAIPATSTLQNPQVTYSTAGTFSVTEIVTNGSGTDSITKTAYIKVNPLPVTPTITQSADTLFCNPATYTFYQWLIKGSAAANATTYRLTVSTTGVYRVTVSDSNGCSAYAQIVVTKIVSGINEISLNDYINVFPNPTTGNLKVQFDIPTDGQYDLSVTNVLGQTMYTNTLHLAGQSTQNIDMSGFSKGIYFLSIKGPNSTGVKKIMLY